MATGTPPLNGGTSQHRLNRHVAHRLDGVRVAGVCLDGQGWRAFLA